MPPSRESSLNDARDPEGSLSGFRCTCWVAGESLLFVDLEKAELNQPWTMDIHGHFVVPVSFLKTNAKPTRLDGRNLRTLGPRPTLPKLNPYIEPHSPPLVNLQKTGLSLLGSTEKGCALVCWEPLLLGLGGLCRLFG